VVQEQLQAGCNYLAEEMHKPFALRTAGPLAMLWDLAYWPDWSSTLSRLRHTGILDHS